MGLGKTPTTLASLALSPWTHGTALVIAPPAVVGNWAAEARKFVPEREGPRAPRPQPQEGPGPRGKAVRAADLVITTYGTAVRDMDELSEIDWGKVVHRRGPGHQEPRGGDLSAAASPSRPAPGWP